MDTQAGNGHPKSHAKLFHSRWRIGVFVAGVQLRLMTGGMFWCVQPFNLRACVFAIAAATNLGSHLVSTEKRASHTCSKRRVLQVSMCGSFLKVRAHSPGVIKTIRAAAPRFEEPDAQVPVGFTLLLLTAHPKQTGGTA